MKRYLGIRITIDDKEEEGKETVLEFFKTFPTTATAIEATKSIMAALKENKEQLSKIMDRLIYDTEDKEYDKVFIQLKRYLGCLFIDLGSDKKAKLPYPVSPNCYINLERMGFDLDTITQEECMKCTKMCLSANGLRSIANKINEKTTWSLRDGNIAILEDEIDDMDAISDGIFIEITLDYDGTPWITFDDALRFYGDLSTWEAEKPEEVKEKVYPIDSVRKYMSEMSEHIWELFLDDWKAKEDGGYEYMGSSKEKMYIGERW